MSNKLVTCPYDEVHRMKESRLALHITKCRLNHLGSEKFTCCYNASHILPIQEKDYHVLNCPDRILITRELAFKALETNNPFKGNTAVPSYTASVPTVPDEVWDEGVDLLEPAPGYVPAEPPPCAIIEPPALSKPAERRKLYQELHRRPTEPENNIKLNKEEPKIQMNRQPKAPSEVESKTANEYRHLGLGRGRPVASAAAPSRIAANIFAPTPAPQNTASNNVNYSSVLSGMSNLGLGRGHPTTTVNDNLTEDNFPALGCGRGVYRTKKNDIRYPGTRN